MKENCGTTGEGLNKSPNLIKVAFSVFYNNFLDTKGTKMAHPIMESSLKTDVCDVFLVKIKK
jgi:hypothetical protein